MSYTKRKPGRPATIDKSIAMQAVVELFRSKGFAAVSLDDLSAVTGLSRPSLYRTFGNKLTMYVEAMDAFGAQVNEIAVPVLDETEDLEAALTGFLKAMLSIYYRDAEIEPGCLVFGTAPSSADQAAIKSRLKFGIEQVDALMRARILKSAPNCQPSQIKAAAEIASNTLIAFSARAKSGATKTELTAMASQAAHSITVLLGVEKVQP